MERIVIGREIPSDNSCLFNAVGYVMDHDKNKASDLRQVIASTVSEIQRSIVKHSLESLMRSTVHGFLAQKSGEVPLSLQYWLITMDVRLQHMIYKQDVICKEKNFDERVMLIYDGLHYDALAMSPFEGAPEEFDLTIFPVQKDRTVGPIEGLALNLVKDEQGKRSYTDTANFTLRCGVCHIGVVGQEEAIEHAQATGHANFQEYS